MSPLRSPGAIELDAISNRWPTLALATQTVTNTVIVLTIQKTAARPHEGFVGLTKRARPKEARYKTGPTYEMTASTGRGKDLTLTLTMMKGNTNE
ncbi:MAG: hypothetical protein ACI9MC_002342 [Kiritimatiellia bacterium]